MAPCTFDQYDYVFVQGDLNYRNNGSMQEITKMIFDRRIEELIQIDQLTQELSSNKLPPGFMEGSVTFLPTFKFVDRTTTYDTSKERNVPSWPDRILYKSKNQQLQQQAYYANFKMIESDHKPIYANFIAQFQTERQQTNIQVAQSAEKLDTT